jgi:hypothetical protein
MEKSGKQSKSLGILVAALDHEEKEACYLVCSAAYASCLCFYSTWPVFGQIPRLGHRPSNRGVPCLIQKEASAWDHLKPGLNRRHIKSFNNVIYLKFCQMASEADTGNHATLACFFLRTKS